MKRLLIVIALILIAGISVPAQVVVVAKDGSGQFTSIQQAINSLPDSSAKPRTVFIKNGFYQEKVFVKKHNLILKGEDREKTIISQSIARDEWRCSNPDDWGVATLNIGANDITLQNLSVFNRFGFDFVKDYTVLCPNDSIGSKIIGRNSHSMALRTMFCTRLKAINCHFSAYSGDTVSPWEVEKGLWYFKDCVMEGGVDFYCPRGWAWAENCEFITHSGSAAIWHDGSVMEDSKTVLVNCSFKGFDGFQLGRYHKDAQFYLINCRFADNMRDAEIYLTNKQTPLKWGKRIYYYNCERKAGNYGWFANNISADLARQISVNWVFNNRWNPLSTN